MMAKQTKKARTVASFLSQRMKQQVNESYDYLEESTKRVHSAPNEEAHEVFQPEPPQERPIQGASTAYRGEAPHSLDQIAISEIAEASESIKADAPTREEPLPVVALAPTPEMVEEKIEALEPAKGDEPETFSAEPVELSSSPTMTLPFESEISQISFVVEPAHVPVLEEPEQPTITLKSEPPATASESKPVEEEKSTVRSTVSAAVHQLIFEDRPSAPAESSPARVQSEKTPRTSKAAPAPVTLTELPKATTAEGREGEFVIPERIFNLLMTGEVPLRGIQIYLAMLRDAGFRIGGVATLSYSQIASLTSIQQPHIPGILKILEEKKLVERFRAEKNATAKNSYTIL